MLNLLKKLNQFISGVGLNTYFTFIFRINRKNMYLIKPSEMYYIFSNYGDYMLMANGKEYVIPADFTFHHVMEIVKNNE